MFAYEGKSTAKLQQQNRKAITWFKKYTTFSRWTPWELASYIQLAKKNSNKSDDSWEKDDNDNNDNPIKNDNNKDSNKQLQQGCQLMANDGNNHENKVTEKKWRTKLPATRQDKTTAWKERS